MPLLLEPEKHGLVEEDHLPRVARYQADSGVGEERHVLYFGPVGLIQSKSEAEWLAQDGALPIDPTPQQRAAAIAALKAAANQADRDASALRQRVIQEAQGTVGQSISTLSATQLRALVAILLWKAGAVDKDGLVLPLNQWVR